VTAGQPVGEARFVRAILLPVRTPSLRRVFRDSDHAECGGVTLIKMHLLLGPSAIRRVSLQAQMRRKRRHVGSGFIPSEDSPRGGCFKREIISCYCQCHSIMCIIQFTTVQ